MYRYNFPDVVSQWVQEEESIFLSKLKKLFVEYNIQLSQSDESTDRRRLIAN